MYVGIPTPYFISLVDFSGVHTLIVRVIDSGGAIDSYTYTFEGQPAPGTAS